MIVSAGNLSNIFTGFKTSFNKGFQGAASTYGKFTMEVPSSRREETSAWRGQCNCSRGWPRWGQATANVPSIKARVAFQAD